MTATGRRASRRRIDPHAPIEIVEGRAPKGHSTVGDWVALSGASDLQCRIYWILRAHINRKRERDQDDSTVWPSQPTLAELVHVKKADTVSKAVGALEELGAVTVYTIATPTGRQNVYEVHLDAPEGYAGLKSLDEFYAARKAVEANRRRAALDAARNCRSDNMTPPDGVPPRDGIPPADGGGVTPGGGGGVTPGGGGKPQEENTQESTGGGRPVATSATAVERPRQAPSSSSSIQLDENDPDTWLCRAHRENPIPADEYRPPCGPCSRVRKSHERKAEQRAAAAAERQAVEAAERARAAAAAVDACVARGWCDGKHVLDPRTGDTLRPVRSCDHETDPAEYVGEAPEQPPTASPPSARVYTRRSTGDRARVPA